MSADPLDDLIERLNEGDISAAECALAAYEPYLRMAVRRRLSGVCAPSSTRWISFNPSGPTCSPAFAMPVGDLQTDHTFARSW